MIIKPTHDTALFIIKWPPNYDGSICRFDPFVKGGESETQPRSIFLQIAARNCKTFPRKITPGPLVTLCSECNS